MTRRSEEAAQDQVRAACEAFVLALPPGHQEVIRNMAADSHKEPYSIVAHALLARLLPYRGGLLPLRRVADPRNQPGDRP